MEKTHDNITKTQEFIDEVARENPGMQRPSLEWLYKPTPTTIKPVTVSEMMLEEPKPVEYICSPILPVQGIAWIYAASGVGKTLFALNLAYAIAQGGTFLKFSCPKPRKVLYIDGEMCYDQLHGRITLIRKQQGELDFSDNLQFITPDKISPFRLPMIDNAEDQNTILTIMEDHGFDLVIFDNLSMLSSIDENKAHEFKIVQDFIIRLRAAGKTTIMIHHAGKEKTGYRGTSKMLDCADIAISLQPVVNEGLEDENLDGKKFKIVYGKARRLGGKDILPFEVNLHNSNWSYKSLEQTEMDRVIEMLGANMSQREIAKELFCSQTKVCKLIKKARSFGLIRD